MANLPSLGRVAGVLLHPTSLPSGVAGVDAYRWVDWLAQAGFRVWQMLPLGVPLVGASPYQCASAFAVNPGLFGATDTAVSDGFEVWYGAQKHWVEDYALFTVLKQQFGGVEWSAWPVQFRDRDPNALFRLRGEKPGEIAAVIDQQYQCYCQWRALRVYAAEKGIALFGDMPIFVAYDSADVWANPQRFLLDAVGQPTWVTGVPPDYFSETGQRWGNPHYNWEVMQQENFLWWRQRLQYHFEFFDLVRIDHFRGLVASWMIAASEPTAVNGYWQPVPGDAMLGSVRAMLGDLPLVAEDLGVITPDVTALRDKYGLPGMGVLQFGFDHFEDNPHKPQNVRENAVYYTGTHDNDTLQGWFDGLDANMQTHVMHVLGVETAAAVVPAMLSTVFASHAQLALVPLQDLLGLGSAARMNTPGTVEGNWQWQFQWQDIPSDLASDLHNVLLQHQRNGKSGHGKHGDNAAAE